MRKLVAALTVLVTLALVATLSGLAASSGRAQVVAAPLSLGPGYPPHPRDMVTLWDGNQTVPNPITPQGSYVAFTVPPDQWLVLTTGDFNYGFTLYERVGSALQKKSGPPNVISGGQPLGATFAPDSQVTFFNHDQNAANLSFKLHGYLVRD